MVNVTFLPDWHGLEESVDLQIREMKKLGIGTNSTHQIFHEAVTNDFFCIATGEDWESEKVRDGTLDLYWNNLALEEQWGPSQPYRKFLDFIDRMGHAVYPLDYSAVERLHLSRAFVEYAQEFLRTDPDERDTLELKLLDLRRRCVDRELGPFAYSIDRAMSDDVVVITHPAHIPRLESYCSRVQGYSTKIAPVDPDLARRLGEKEDEVQLDFAAKNRILAMEKPPLVPAVTLAWGLPDMQPGDLRYKALYAAAGKA